MSHYERRLEADKDAIRQRLGDIGRDVEQALAAAAKALLAGDREACSRLILGDLPINRASRALDQRCHAFVARHLPSAGHLRFISSVLRLNVALERVGDYAVTVCREAVQFDAPPPESVRASIEELTNEAVTVLRRAIKAFLESDAELARETKPRAKAFAHSYERVHNALLAEESGRSLKDLFATLSIYNKLDRVCDQAKNICEEAIFAVTGETKAPKVYRILFVEGRDSLVAPLAVAIARKAFPGSGRYDSAGWAPANDLAPEAWQVGKDLALDLTGLHPSKLEDDVDALSGYHVVVLLNGGGARHVTARPYSTVFITWELPRLDPENLESSLRTSCQQLSSQIHELMVTMRGEEAP